MKLFLALGLMAFSSIAAASHGSDPATNLDSLFEQVTHERQTEQQRNKQRETTFIEQKQQQAALLAAAKQSLAQQEARSDKLNAQFKEQETSLTEQEAVLKQASGALGELFGTVRQVANESRSVLVNSLTSVELTERKTFLDELAEQKAQPNIDQIRQLWLTLQQEMTESGKVKRLELPVITTQGVVEDKEVTRVGVFSIFAGGTFLRYLPEANQLVELGRQPVSRLQTIAADFQAATGNEIEPVVIDPTRGAIMDLLVQAPTLKERIAQGGGIGFIILALGLIGLVVALVRFTRLTQIARGVDRQQAQDTVSLDNPLGRILSVYRDALAHDVDTLSLKLDEAILREIPTIERGLLTLSVLAAVAPMLGLLGTVSGMIETFQSITLFGTGDPKLMSGGISQALVTTELGLAVAIPLLFIHSLLSAKSNRLVQILDEESAALIAHKAEKRYDQSEQ